LHRIFRILRENNPSLGLGKKVTLPPPLVFREGSKRTIFANIYDQAVRLHRNLDHFKDYLFAELGTNGSVDASNRLILKGRFQQKQLENVVRRYIHEYVTCKTCKSPDTLLAKENRVWFIACENCGSKRSVSAIKTGFQAQTAVYSPCVWSLMFFRNGGPNGTQPPVDLKVLVISGAGFVAVAVATVVCFARQPNVRSRNIHSMICDPALHLGTAFRACTYRETIAPRMNQSC